MSTVPTTFARERRSLGYDPGEVDRFVAAARASYDGRGDRLSAADIRRTAFSMRRGGYTTVQVDAALERLEDAFALRERETVLADGGERAFYASTRQLAKEIIARLERPDGKRFARVGFARIGYAVRDVDRFAVQARAYFEQGSQVAVDRVRTIAFRPQRGGYSEGQVDLLIDGLVEAMLAVR